jgi:Ras-like protein family protein 11A
MFFISAENRYKHEVLVDGEPILFEILDTCPKVRILL